MKKTIFLLLTLFSALLMSCSKNVESSPVIQIDATPHTRIQLEIVEEISQAELVLQNPNSTDAQKHVANNDLMFAQYIATMAFAPTPSPQEFQIAYDEEMTRIAIADSVPKPVPTIALGLLSSDDPRYTFDTPRDVAVRAVWQGYINGNQTLIYTGNYYPEVEHTKVITEYGIVYVVTYLPDGSTERTMTVTDEEVGGLYFDKYFKNKGRIALIAKPKVSCDDSDAYTNGNGQNNGNGHDNHNGNGYGHNNCDSPCDNGQGNGNANKNKNNNGNCGNGNGNSNKIYFDLATGQFVSSLNEPVFVTPTPIPPSTPTPEPASVAYP